MSRKDTDVPRRLAGELAAIAALLVHREKASKLEEFQYALD